MPGAVPRGARSDLVSISCATFLFLFGVRCRWAWQIWSPHLRVEVGTECHWATGCARMRTADEPYHCMAMSGMNAARRVS